MTPPSKVKFLIESKLTFLKKDFVMTYFGQRLQKPDYIGNFFIKMFGVSVWVGICIWGFELLGLIKLETATDYALVISYPAAVMLMWFYRLNYKGRPLKIIIINFLTALALGTVFFLVSFSVLCCLFQ